MDGSSDSPSRAIGSPTLNKPGEEKENRARRERGKHRKNKKRELGGTRTLQLPFFLRATSLNPSMAEASPHVRPLFVLSLLLLLVSPSLAEIKHLRIESDSRSMILFEEFGFTPTGHVTISVSSVSWTPENPASSTTFDPSTMGFLLLTEESLLQIIAEIEQLSHFCVLRSPHAHLLFDFHSLDTSTRSYNQSFPVTIPNQYSLFFANCRPDFRVTMNVRTEIYNLEGNVRDYLPAGQTQLPKLYLAFALLYFAFLFAWVYFCLRFRNAVHRIHALMGGLLLVKGLNLLCAAEDKFFVKRTGTPHGWDVVFYIFQFVRGILLFTVIILVGTGWSFLKPFLQEREKKVLMIVIPLQVVANIASVVIDETGPFSKDWATWRQLFLLIDIACCCAIIFPIVWSIRALREASKTDGKAARNLAKLTLFRQFYMVVVGYLYLTRIVVFALKTITAYKYRWVSTAVEEAVTLVFYAFMFYMFRPVEKNQYFVLDDEEEEAAQAALQDEEFEL
ncbi:Gpr107 protein [Nymphaea thermarum]|nr:Gpr107 protein [Nymphaea thermarum]